MSEQSSSTEVQTVVHPHLTPYGLAKVLSELTGEEFAPQPFYGMHSRQAIKTVTIPGDKKKYFDGDAVAEYIKMRLAGGFVAGTGRVDYAALAQQFLAEATEDGTDDGEQAVDEAVTDAVDVHSTDEELYETATGEKSETEAE